MRVRSITYGIGGLDASKPNGNVIEDVEIDIDDVPLDPAGALATLLATKGILTTKEAADAVGRLPADLIAEAEAWAVAAEIAAADAVTLKR